MSQTEVQLIKDAAVVTADIADQAVTLDKLPHGTSSNNGKFLRANNGADPSFETVTSTTINSNADNRIITGSGTANTLNAESEFTFDGSNILCRAGEGGNASLNLIADEGDDNGDGWKIQSEQDENDLTFKSNISGSYVDKLKLKSSGQLECQGNLEVSGTITPTGNVVIPATIVHTGDSNTKIRFPAADTFTVETAGSERIRINSDGDFLVGRTTTIDTSEIFGIKGPSGDHCTFGITTDGTTNLGIISFNDNDANFRGQIRYRHSSDQLEIFTAATERFRFESGGNLKLLDGDLVIGASGHGIDFSDTSDASGMTSELLDDYEEGTWTALLNANISESQVAARYVKIGRSVTAHFYVNIAGSFGGAAGAADTSLVISGLPYAAAGSSFHTGVIDVGNGGAAGAFLRVSGGSSTMSVLVSSGSVGTPRTHLRGNTIGTGDYVIGSITYQTG